jgi:hypothetical protein
MLLLRFSGREFSVFSMGLSVSVLMDDRRRVGDGLLGSSLVSSSILGRLGVDSGSDDCRLFAPAAGDFGASGAGSGRTTADAMGLRKELASFSQ